MHQAAEAGGAFAIADDGGAAAQLGGQRLIIHGIGAILLGLLGDGQLNNR